ncbi:DEAD-box ATP-dependent RNA helicase 38 [Tanacetum coccineum]
MIKKGIDLYAYSCDELALAGYRDLVVTIMKGISKRSLQYQAVGSTISNDVVEVFVSKTKQVLRTMEVPSLDNVKQYKVNEPDEISKINIIQNKILDHNPKVGQTIICVHTKESVGMLCEAPEDNKFMLKTIDAAYTQEQRDKILKEFEEKRFQVLISTEILD